MYHLRGKRKVDRLAYSIDGFGLKVVGKCSHGADGPNCSID